MNILIVGYGNIGKHMVEEFKALQPDIYDPYITEYSTKQKKLYDFAFICVSTDMKSDGSCDTSIVEQAIKETDAEIIVIKSTVPPGTTNRLIDMTGKKIVFSPEHYGVTQHCKSDPGFVILGGDKELCARVAQIYAKVKNGYYKNYFTDSVAAELSKYMLNSFLALKVTFCNEFADLAEKFDVNYPELRELFVADERVGNSHTFVYPDKPYYDSHCFNKDVPALIKFSGDSAPLMTCVDKLNSSKKLANNEIFIKTNFQAKYAGKTYLIGKPPEDIRTELMRIQKADKLKNRAELIKKSLQKNFKYECSICLIIRDESEYLEEWLNWHIKQGVQHFYIYDHGSKQPVAEFVWSLGSEIADKVTIIDWSGLHDNAQPNAYNDCLNRFREESKWIGFIDTDEHVRVKTGQSLPEFLNGYTDQAGVMAIWIVYGADGQVKKSKLPLRQRFLQRRISEARHYEVNYGKVFVQPYFMKDMYIHNGIPENGLDVVDESKRKVSEGQIWIENATTELICVDHYYTKSYEEWLEKMRRGRCHALYMRKYEEFFGYNPDMEYCREEVYPSQEYEVSHK